MDQTWTALLILLVPTIVGWVAFLWRYGRSAAVRRERFESRLKKVEGVIVTLPNPDIWSHTMKDIQRQIDGMGNGRGFALIKQAVKRDSEMLKKTDSRIARLERDLIPAVARLETKVDSLTGNL